MKEYNCDLHFHGPYSGGVSKNMLLPVIAGQAPFKGLDVVCTADILHGKWFEHVKGTIKEESNGIYGIEGQTTKFIVSTEVQCKDRIHHLIYLPSLESALELREKVKDFGILDSWGCGRPRLRLAGREIAERVFDAGGIIGPAHAFTPYFSVYAHFNSLEGSYGELQKKIDFIELGLSADSDYADMIGENHNYNFFTFSDAHSPWPHRIGREFTRIKMSEPSFKGLVKALKARAITLNAGLDPKEGKYHRTACNNCYAKFSMNDAAAFKWRCPKCREGEIKKGVRDRIEELADSEKGKHPEFRPPYLHILPLAEIIQLSLGVENVNSQKVQSLWKDYIDRFGNEINVLTEAKAEELKELDESIGKSIEAFRNGFVVYEPGGGGEYGKPVICRSMEECEKKEKEIEEEFRKNVFAGQKTLGEYK